MAKKRQLSINIIAGIVSTICTFLISFFLTPYISETLGKETYQFYPISNNFIYYMTIAVTALNSMSARFITVEVVRDNREEVNVLYSSLLYANILLCAILAVPSALIVFFCNRFLNIPPQSVRDVKILFALIFGGNLINVYGNVYSAATTAKDRVDLNSWKTLGVSTLRAGVIVLLFALFPAKIWYVGVGALAMYSAQTITQYIFTKKLIPYVDINLNNFRWETVKAMLGSGVWNAIYSFGSSLLTGLLLIFINSLVSDTAGGNYSLTNTLTEVVITVLCMISAVFTPRILRSYAAGGAEDLLREEVLLSQKVTALFGAMPVILFAVFGDAFFRLWVPKSYSPELYRLLLLSLTAILLEVETYSLFIVFVAYNRVKVPAIVSLLMGTLNIICVFAYKSLFEISAYSIICICILIKVMMYSVFYPIYTSRLLKISARVLYKPMLSSAAAVFVLAFVGRTIKQRIEISSWIEFFLWGAIFGIVTLLVYLFLLFKPNKIFELFRKENTIS